MSQTVQKSQEKPQRKLVGNTNIDLKTLDKKQEKQTKKGAKKQGKKKAAGQMKNA